MTVTHAVQPERYRPFALPPGAPDWVADLELEGATALGKVRDGAEPLRVLVLYGSLRARSFSKLLAYEFARCGPGGGRCPAFAVASASAAAA